MTVSKDLFGHFWGQCGSNFMHEWRFSVAIVMSVHLLTVGWRNNAHYLDGQTSNNNSQGRGKKED